MISSTNDKDRGYLLYAHNNASIDYACLAICNALLIKKSDCAVKTTALITDDHTVDYMHSIYGSALVDAAFDHIIVDDPMAESSGNRRYHDTRYTSFVDRYYNANRPNAYQLSPFAETLMLDSDYLILDDTLDMVWGSVEDFMCNTKTRDLNHNANDFGFDNRFNDMSIPLYWATAVYFRKVEQSALIFQLMEFIREHYAYYQFLYRFMPSSHYRNDYALSIAIHMANNLMEYESVASLPVDHILFSMEHDEMHAFKDGRCIITSEPEKGEFRLHTVDRNIHMMNKRSIVRNKDAIIRYATS